MLVSVAAVLAFAGSAAAVSVEAVWLLVTAACFCSSAGGAVSSVVDSLLVFSAGAVSVVDSLLVLSSTVVLELVPAAHYLQKIWCLKRLLPGQSIIFESQTFLSRLICYWNWDRVCGSQLSSLYIFILKRNTLWQKIRYTVQTTIYSSVNYTQLGIRKGLPLLITKMNYIKVSTYK